MGTLGVSGGRCGTSWRVGAPLCAWRAQRYEAAAHSAANGLPDRRVSKGRARSETLGR